MDEEPLSLCRRCRPARVSPGGRGKSEQRTGDQQLCRYQISPGGKTYSACSLRRTTGKISAMCPFVEKLVEQEISLLSITERYWQSFF